MFSILIRGGNSEAAARDLSAAIAQIFDAEPTRLPSVPRKPVLRGMIEAALIVLALPPALIGTADLMSRVRLRERLRALSAKVEEIRKTTKSSVFVDPGDGKHIPLEEASPEAILAALADVEQRLKARAALTRDPLPADQQASRPSKAP